MPAWETGSDGALAEKIRSRLEVLDRPGVGRVTASFGVTAFAGGEFSESIGLPIVFYLISTDYPAIIHPVGFSTACHIYRERDYTR